MRPNRLFSMLLLPMLLLGFAAQAAAQFTTQAWSTASLTRGSGTADLGCFDIGELLFSPIELSGLISINNPGNGRGHGDGTYELEVRTGGIWVSILSVSLSGVSVTFASISTPITFASSIIDGFRLTGNPPDNCSFHSTNGAMTFTFAEKIIPVPSLSDAGRLSLALILLATGVFAGRRWLV